jgi:RecA-family ATPase
MLEIYQGMEFVKAELPIIPWLIHPIIPSTGIVLFHGSPGIGKSTIAWQLANNIEQGSALLGMLSNKARVLLLSLDMPKYGLHARWKESNFEPLFDLVITDNFDPGSSAFPHSEVFKAVRAWHETHNYQLVIVDSLAHVVANGKSVNADEAVGPTYDNFKKWFPNTCIMFIHHDRKKKMKEDGSWPEPTDEDFIGSQQWKSQCTTQLHLSKANNTLLKLHLSKTQVGPQWNEPMELYMNEQGTELMEYGEHQQKDDANQYTQWIKQARVDDLEFDKRSKKNQMNVIAKISGKSIPTLYRMRRSVDIQSLSMLIS